jgi:hypothetical protein
MHDPIGLLKLAAFVAILRNSICSGSCSSAELLCMKQIPQTNFASRANVTSALGREDVCNATSKAC